MLGLLVLAISIGMAVDASNIGYDSGNTDGFSPGPVGWFFFALFLPMLAVPIYLIRRPALREAADRRRLQAQAFAALPGAVYSAYAYGQAHNPYGPRPPHPGAYPSTGPYPTTGPYPGAPYPGQAPYGAPPPQPHYGGPPPQPPYGGPAQPPYGSAPQQPPQAQPPSQPAPEQHHASSSSSMTAGDLAEGIRQLSDLRDRGLLTEEEFQARKAALLRKV